MERPSLPARRPNTGAGPGRCTICLAADTHRPLWFSFENGLTSLLRLILFPVGQEFPEIVALAQRVKVAVLLQVLHVRISFGECPAQQLEGTAGVRLGLLCILT